MSPEYRVAGNCHDYDVSGVYKAIRQNAEGCFRAYRVQNFRFGVELYSKYGLHVSSSSFFEIWAAVVCVSAGCRILRSRVQRLYYFGKRHVVGLAHSHVYEFNIGLGGFGRALGPLNLFKLVYCRAFPVVDSADSFGE